jgi:hypothetical protein
MLHLLFDENSDWRILEGIKRILPEAELLTVQGVSLRKTPDPILLDWSAARHLILVTHDENTVPRFAYERLAAGDYLPGVFIVPDAMPIGDAIDELVLIIACSDASEWENRVVYLPL